MITHKQLTLAEIFKDCQNKFDNDKYHFLVLLDEAINLDEIVPVSFISRFHTRTGRPPQASALSDAESPSDSAHLLNPHRFTPDLISEILSGIA